MITLFITDLLKIILAKKLKSNLNTAFYYKNKKIGKYFNYWFWSFIVNTRSFPDNIQEGLEYIPKTNKGLE